MASKLEEIEKLILQLSIKEKTQLVHQIIESLDENVEDLSEDDFQNAWNKELDRRSQEIRENRVSLIPAKDVLEKARSMLK